MCFFGIFWVPNWVTIIYSQKTGSLFFSLLKSQAFPAPLLHFLGHFVKSLQFFVSPIVAHTFSSSSLLFERMYGPLWGKLDQLGENLSQIGAGMVFKGWLFPILKSRFSWSF